MFKHFWKIFKKLSSLCWKLAKILFVLVFILGTVLLYRLHNEPIDASQYLPEIEAALFPKDSGYHLETESVILTSDWARDGLIQVDIKNMKVLREDNSTVFETPFATVSYDLWHILTLNYLPSTFILEKPFIEMIIDEKGELAVKAEKSSAHVVDLKKLEKMIRRILAIRDLQISDAHLYIKDLRLKQEWDMPHARIFLKRRFHFTHIASFNAKIKGEGVDSQILAKAHLNRFTKNLSTEMGLDQINLKKLSQFIPVLKEADLDIQLSLKGQFDIARNHKKLTDYMKKLQFNIKTLKEGTLNLMGDLDNIYYIQSADINGTLGAEAKTLKIASSQIHLKNEKPVDFYLDVTGIDDFLNAKDLNKLKTVLKATLYDLPIEKVPTVWPSKQGPDAHEWVKTHLSKGFVKQADFSLYFTGGELTDLLGDIHTEGVRVDYLPPMKALDDVSAQVLLYPDKVHILVEKAQIGELLLENADLLFTDVDKDETYLTIDLGVSGPITRVLELISSKPLEFPQMFNLKPSLISGQSKTTVHLAFPLLDDLSTKDVQVNVHSDVTEVKVNKPLDYLDLKEGKFALDVSNEKMKLDGHILMKNSPLDIVWQEYFTPSDVASDYSVSGTLFGDDIGQLVPALNSLIDGKIQGKLTAQKNAKTTLLSGHLILDGKKALMDLALLAVQKRLDNPMQIVVDFTDVDSSFNRGKLSYDVSGSISENTTDLKIHGDFEWSQKLMKIVLTQLIAGINQFSGEFKSSASDFYLALKGKNWQAYDLSRLLQNNTQEKSKSFSGKNIILDIQLDKLFMNPKKPFKNLSIIGKRKGNLWQNFQMTATMDKDLKLSYDPINRQFLGSFSDLSDLMERLGLSNYFRQGEISLSAFQKEKGDIDGKIKVKKTELKETGFLVQAMTILGIVDALQGKDILFDEIEIPFILTPDFKLTLKDAYAVGTNLGITFKGDIQKGQINLSGSVIPAYAVNSLPGKLPIVGWLFRDSEAGGLISVPYSVTGTLFNPQINWNPLGTVVPGALGRLLDF